MSTVGYEALGQVARITVERPEALNALSTAVLLDLDEAISRATREAPRAVVLTGAGGKAFVAGADVAEMAGMSRLGAAAFGALGNRVFRALEQLPMPVIAAVNGFALGGGCELALACDLRIASETAVFAQPEVGLGITPGFGGTQRLARLIGPARAKELLFTARRVDAPEALAIGLVNRVVAAEDLSDEALALADRIAVLRHGRFVQIGTPVEIWREPIDSFVAKGLGQPEINVIDAVAANGRMTALAGAVDVPKPEGLPDGNVRLGLRPSELVPGVQGADSIQITGTVRIAERLGRDIELDVTVGDGHLIVVSDSSKAVGEGKDVVLSIDVAQIHVFAGGEPGEDTVRLGSAKKTIPAKKEVEQ